MECANLWTAVTGRCFPVVRKCRYDARTHCRYRSASIELTQLSANVEMLQLQLKAAHAQILAEWSPTLPYLAYPWGPSPQLMPCRRTAQACMALARRLNRTVCAEASSAATIAENDGGCDWRAPQS
jgi:hypothetical protein